MNLRQTLRWRVGVIVILGFFSIVLILVLLTYVSQEENRLNALPQPQQLAAIVDLLEQTPPSAREKVFEALRSTQMSLRIAAEDLLRLPADLSEVLSDPLVFEEATAP